MFTGIVRERGRVVSAEGGSEGLRLEIEAPLTAGLTAVGDSVSVDGADLTAETVADGRMSFRAVPETVRRTNLARLTPGSEVNLEPALRTGDPLGGHYVQGHVDGLGRVRSVEPEGEGARLWVETPPELLRYCVEKGSVTVQGVALTIADLADDAFAVALIPFTLAQTTLASLRPGDAVNLEVDVLAKYVERLVQTDRPGTISRG
jgi:riboflavin synthase alpha subunit